ncbi:hypothetical protein D0C16_05565 [Cellvibrio sp. KY-GH-1]|uniref:Cro/CI family transcriptional regulator n=1 Tax=Cellvibrio sp. KY-GH-1 TaxID=2303332 RepID=UPI001247992E|nr:Cro/CI family transcriptional regulator [Cellvibrio sp. KY-GH-1]QEY15488.1 hypothetical protein D0C16_05565 [Cellvibrio sp. KY-GH-1]
MKKIPLSEFCSNQSQLRAAEIIGCSQSAVSQMLASKRAVFIIENDDGSFGCEEIRKPKAKKAA